MTAIMIHEYFVWKCVVSFNGITCSHPHSTFCFVFLRHLCTKPPNGYCAFSSLLLQAMGQMKIFHTPACVTNKTLTLNISKLIVLLIEKSLIVPIIQIKSIMFVANKTSSKWVVQEP